MMKGKWLGFMGVMFVLCVCTVFCGNRAEAKAKKYTISTKTVPVDPAVRNMSSYNKNTKHYYTIQSYLNKMAGKGGTLRLKKGTYKIPCTLYVPSNVTIRCDSGVKLQKTDKTGTKELKSTKYMFQLVSEKKAGKQAGVAKYKASAHVSIVGNGTVKIDLGKVNGAKAIYAGHARSVTISNIQFSNKRNSNYIWVEGSKNVQITKCRFYGGMDKNTVKSQLAVRLETINADVNGFSGKWSRLDNTVNRNIKITDNTFYAMNSCIGTTKHVASRYQKEITISGNTFHDTRRYAVYAIDWMKPSIRKNKVSKSSASLSTKNFVRGLGVYNPDIRENTIAVCDYAIYFDKAENSGAGKKMRANASTVSERTAVSMENNIVSGLKHYYVMLNGKRLFYFRNKNDKNFTITTTTKPYHEKYTDKAKYETYKMYYMFLSYMEQLEYAGGGTITIEPGTYLITNNICIPSNVTMKLKDGVILRKSGERKKTVAYGKTLITIVPPSKDNTKATVSGYNGSSNVKIIGEGNATIDCAYKESCMGIVMGHTRNVTIRGIRFLNERGLHFIELNSSQNTVVENCSFIGFQITNEKSHKECINVDATDVVTNGFVYSWSSHDKTTCKDIYIRNNYFKNVGTAIGSHTFTVNGNDQLYHENVQITNNVIDTTYNAAVHALNWKDCVISGNTFQNVSTLKDGKLDSEGKQISYTTVLMGGVVNPIVKENTFDAPKYYPIRVVMTTEPTTKNTKDAGYPDTVSKVSDANWQDMQNNTIINAESEEDMQYILVDENNNSPETESHKLAIGHMDAE